MITTIRTASVALSVLFASSPCLAQTDAPALGHGVRGVLVSVNW